MTITFNPILLEDPKFRELISHKEILSIYRSLHNATVENITFFNDKTCRVIYSYPTSNKPVYTKQEITKNPPYNDIYSISQERNLLIITYSTIQPLSLD